MRRLIPFATYSYTLLVVVASLAKLVITFVPDELPNSDKFAHAIAYFGFAIVWTLFFFIKNKGNSKKEYIKGMVKAGVFGIVFGIFMEIAQLTLTDYRQFDVNDAFANTLGVVLAMPILYYFASFFMLIKKRGI